MEDNNNQGLETETQKVVNEPQQQSTTEPNDKKFGIDEAVSLLGNATVDVLLKIPSVKTLVETARTQEKDKVYKSIESKEQKIKTLEEELASNKNLLKDKENTNLTEQEILMKQIRELNEQVTNLKDSIENERLSAEAEKKLARFEAYKQKRLRELFEAGTEYLPDLIGGSNEEEFEKTVNKAVSRYAELKEQLSAKISANTNTKPNSASVTNPSSNQVQTLNLEDIKKMTPEQYAKVRESVLKQAKI